MRLTSSTMLATILAGALFLPMIIQTESAVDFNFSVGTNEQLELQRSYYKWYWCHFTEQIPRSIDALVPDNTIFIDGESEDGPPNCTQQKYNRTIATGTQTVFVKINALSWYDCMDDWEMADPECTPANTSQGQMELILNLTNQDNEAFTAEPTKDSMYARVDGQDMEVFYLFDSYEHLLVSCPDGQTCWRDYCDAVPIMDCSGIDAYPMYGYWALDVREWRSGETHIYDFGGFVPLEFINLTDFFGLNVTGSCSNVQYTLTASNGTKPSDNSSAYFNSSVGTTEQLELQRSYWEWRYCHDNETVPRRIDALVPDNVIFVEGVGEAGPPNCTQQKYNGTIATGTQTVFVRLSSIAWYDWVDDWEMADPGCTPANTSEGQMEFMLTTFNQENEAYAADSTKQTMHATVDGRDMEVFYLFDSYKHLLVSCLDGRNCTEDTCDAVPIMDCSGIDVYPMLGYWAMDVREWGNGETHVFEFGGFVQFEGLNFTGLPGANMTGLCNNVQYNLTASDGTKPSDNSSASNGTTPPPSSAFSVGRENWLAMAFSILFPLSALILHAEDDLWWFPN